MIKWWLIIYTFSIGAFGGIYYFLWLSHPDTFLFNEQYNLHPFSSDEIGSVKNDDLQYFLEKKDSLKKQLDFEHGIIKTKQKLLDSLELVYDKSHSLLEKERWDSIEIWKKKQVPKALRDSLDIISNLINEYEKSGNRDRYALSKLKVKTKTLELAILKIDIESSNFAMNNLLLFTDSLFLKELKKSDSLYNQLKYDEIPQRKFNLGLLDYKMESLRFEWFDQYYHRVDFMDFLLFSASNASTVTYGDIIPNSTSARLLAFLQAIICICLIAFFTDALLRKHLQPPVKGDKESSTGKTSIVEHQVDVQIIEEAKVYEEERRNRRRLRKYAAHGRRPLNNK